jgi:putative hydrolase of the HAD superfamily
MIRAFLFDIGNVILRFDFHIALRKLATQSGTSDPTTLLTQLEPVKFMLEDGQIDRASFVRSAIDALRYRGTEAGFIAAFEDIFEENAPMSALIARLHAHYPLYLLSNTNDIHVDYFTRRYPVFQHFCGGVYSHRARASKPNPEIYRIACRELGLAPQTTFFIDDLLPNIETARSLGFQTHHYHHERHSELLAALEAAGVPPSL